MSDKSKQETGKESLVAAFIEGNKRGAKDVEDMVMERKKEGSTTKKEG